MEKFLRLLKIQSIELRFTATHVLKKGAPRLDPPEDVAPAGKAYPTMLFTGMR